MYAQVARFVGNRKDLTEDRLDGLEELVMDSTKAQAVFEAARMSMGKLHVFVDSWLFIAEWTRPLCEHVDVHVSTCTCTCIS